MNSSSKPRWKFDYDDDTIIILPITSNIVNFVFEDMMRVNAITWQLPQMVNKPLVADKKGTSVQKQSLGVMARKKLVNLSLRHQMPCQGNRL
jgi:hypothetical protein